jgi:hypothetical protein
MTDQARRADAYRKITLGGLVIKAGLGDVDAATLLGLLVDGATRLADPQEAARLHQIGDATFREHRHAARPSGSVGPAK